MFYSDDSNKPFASTNNLAPYIALDGLENFIRSIEKDFFTEVEVYGIHDDDTKKTDLVITVHCNYSIEDSVHYFKKGEWGGCTSCEKTNRVRTTFRKAFQRMKKQNKNIVDIGELSFHFEDTSIIMAKIHDHSIPKHTDTLLFEISRHFAYLTKGVSEIPYEIFVPVFEDSEHECYKAKQKKISYFNYWGLYTEDDTGKETATVYELATKTIQAEEFSFL